MIDDFIPSERNPYFLQNIFYLPEEVITEDTTPEKFINKLGVFYPRYDHSYFLNLMKELEVDANKKFNAMSYGQKKKSLLACALSLRTDYLLLDEPTNHLDISTIEILEEIINEFRGAVVVISHDRMFLNKIVNKVMKNASNDNLARKLESDAVLNTIKDNIAMATNCLSNNNEQYIAGAITIKYKNRVYILISGYDKEFKKFSPNYFLHYQLIEYYKKDYDFIDLNGITGDFTDKNPYKGLDEFKLGFNPHAFEYIGEYDLIINESLYKAMEQNGQLAKEFNIKENSTNK